MEFHEIAEVFPTQSDEHIHELMIDILQNGLLEPVVLFEGKVLDGRHRWLACDRAGAVATTVEFEGDWEKAVRFVTSKNLKRYHLDKTDRIMAASRLSAMSKGRPKIGNVADFPQAELAEQFDVSVRSIGTGRRVLDHGVPELVEAVDRKEIPVHKAAALTRLDPEQQREVLAQGPVAAKQAASDLQKKPVVSDTQKKLAEKQKKTDTLFDLQIQFQQIKVIVGRLASHQPTLSDGDREVGRLLVEEFRAVVDWMEILFNGDGISDEAIAKLLDGGQQ